MGFYVPVNHQESPPNPKGEVILLYVIQSICKSSQLDPSCQLFEIHDSTLAHYSGPRVILIRQMCLVWKYFIATGDNCHPSWDDRVRQNLRRLCQGQVSVFLQIFLICKLQRNSTQLKQLHANFKMSVPRPCFWLYSCMFQRLGRATGAADGQSERAGRLWWHQHQRILQVNIFGNQLKFSNCLDREKKL